MYVVVIGYTYLKPSKIYYGTKKCESNINRFSITTTARATMHIKVIDATSLRTKKTSTFKKNWNLSHCGPANVYRVNLSAPMGYKSRDK